MSAGVPVFSRQYVGKNIPNFMELPDLIDIQLSSYRKFLNRGGDGSPDSAEDVGLEEVFRSVFPIESPNIDSIVVNKVGKVRRAKLYYLRNLTGKKARIAEKRTVVATQ